MNRDEKRMTKNDSMQLKHYILLLFLFLLSTTAWARTRSVEKELVPIDTAWTDPVGYIDNLADSVRVNGHSFAGPGPFSVHFEAQMTEKPIYTSWEISTDNTFSSLLDQFHAVESDGRTAIVEYDFDEAGTYYVRFQADILYSASKNGILSDTLHYTTAEPYQIQVTESLLEIPNVITPDSPSGKNQVFKVKYKSLVSFEMLVYNRWGQELYHTTDPSEGWDGTYGGSIVPTGAYYYIIKAEGTEGHRYVERGAVNVLKSKDNSRQH